MRRVQVLDRRKFHFRLTFMTPPQSSLDLHGTQYDELFDCLGREFAFPGMLRKWCRGTFRHARQKDVMVPLKLSVTSQNLKLLVFWASRSSG